MIFIDTGAFLARYIKRDQHHTQAQAAWNVLSRRNLGCFTSNFVLDETLTLLGRRVSHSFAAGRGKAILSSESLKILRPSPEDEWQALELFEKLADQAVSFTDCVSFALMRKNRLKRAFSYDRHFLHAGFRLWPENGR